MAMFAREETNQGETFRSANVDFSLPFCAAVMVSVVVVVVAVLVVVEGTDLALIRDMDGWMRDVVVMGTAFCCTVSTSDSESDDSVGVSLRRFLDPFEFTSLRSLWLLLADESLELPESEPEMEAAILEYSPIEPLY
jgi:hypothetical protein